jgi:hypothetical protein
MALLYIKKFQKGNNLNELPKAQIGINNSLTPFTGRDLEYERQYVKENYNNLNKEVADKVFAYMKLIEEADAKQKALNDQRKEEAYLEKYKKPSDNTKFVMPTMAPILTPEQKAQAGVKPTMQDVNKEWIKEWMKARYDSGKFEKQLGNGQMEKGFKTIDNLEKVSRERMVKRGNDDASFWQIGAPEGMYIPSANIYFSDPGFFTDETEGTVDVHEQSHAFDIGTSGAPKKNMEESIPETNIHKAIKNIPTKGGYKTEQYLHPAEIFAELMKFRKKNNINPKKIYTRDDLPELRKKLKKETPYGLFNLDDIYEDEEILRLMNEIASIDTLQENNIRYAKHGGSLLYNKKQN